MSLLSFSVLVYFSFPFIPVRVTGAAGKFFYSFSANCSVSPSGGGHSAITSANDVF
jgi:hypothetical protein